MNIAIAAGGTAGHINPALSVAEELRERGHKICFYGQGNRLEHTLVPEAGFDFYPLELSGFDRSRPWTLATAMLRLKKAQHKLRQHFEQLGFPDCALGFGAYIELPLMRLCLKRRIPCFLHEQNSVPGLANRVLASQVKAIFVTKPAAQGYFSADKYKSGKLDVVVSGNPVRRAILDTSRAEARVSLGLAKDELLLVIFGGSLGAKTLNQLFSSYKGSILAHKKCRVIQSTGEKLFAETQKLMNLSEEEKLRWEIRPYIHNMAEVLAGADLVISRAGASSIAEIAATGVPSLLVPYPYATADHQTKNASMLLDAGAAFCFSDAELLDDPKKRFVPCLQELLASPEKRAEMRRRALSLSQAQAAKLIADYCEKHC